MSVLANLEPKEVFHFFEEISQIPRGSGNIKRISDYLVNFSRERNLVYYQDKLGNVIITKEATPGHEDREPIIIQGHMDMVAVKTPECPLDMKTDGLVLRVQGDDVSAAGTSLGGDDGIAVAYALALLDSKQIAHPRLEVVITADEETGMDGASGFDPAWITGRRLLNLDSEEEGQFIISSAGGKTVTARFPLEWEKCDLPVYAVTVDGLRGGHSGAEIHRGLANANQLLSRMLAETDCRLIAVNGGTKNNVITAAATALIAAQTPPDAEAWTARFREEYKDRENALRVSVAAAAAPEMQTETVSARVKRALATLPHGVREWSREMEGLAETSDNLAILKTDREAITAILSIRSMKNEERDRFSAELTALLEKAGAAVSCAEGYPAWEYRADSPLRDALCDAYRAETGSEPRLVALHAGLECGLFCERLPGLDAVSFGPDIKEIHSPRERLNLASAERCWELIKAVLARL